MDNGADVLTLLFRLARVGAGAASDFGRALATC